MRQCLCEPTCCKIQCTDHVKLVAYHAFNSPITCWLMRTACLFYNYNKIFSGVRMDIQRLCSIARNLHFSRSSDPWTGLVLGIHIENSHEIMMMMCSSSLFYELDKEVTITWLHSLSIIFVIALFSATRLFSNSLFFMVTVWILALGCCIWMNKYILLP